MTRFHTTRAVPIGLIAALVVFGVDQASKWWILDVLDLPSLGSIAVLPVLNLTMVWNRGVTFGLLNGIGAWSSFVLAAVALAIVGALFLWLRRATSALIALALGSIAGGAIGNVLDRLRYGAVVDFIHAHAGGWSWYVFNVADAAIVCGVGVLVADSFLHRDSAPMRDGQPTTGPATIATGPGERYK